MSASETPMPVFSRESAEEAYNAMVTKEGRKELLRNHLVEFLAPHASHLLSTGINAMFSGNTQKTAGQGGASSGIRNAAGAARAALLQGAGSASSLARASLASAADVASSTVRDKADSVIHAARAQVPDPQSVIPSLPSVNPGSPGLPLNPSTMQNAATGAAQRAMAAVPLNLVDTPPRRTPATQTAAPQTPAPQRRALRTPAPAMEDDEEA